ncbi:MAG: 2-methylaconitate cis-trans isomerase PrpF family protein [Nocardioidaceae bacterium]
MPGGQIAVPYVLMRGGTSKCHFFYDHDLPQDGERDRVLLSALGSPDPRQIDGVGGATSLTSKVCIVHPGPHPDVDVAFTFAQVAVDRAVVDYGGTCGNCSAAVGPFAIEEGLVDAKEPLTSVRVLNTNTGKRFVAEVHVTDGLVDVAGDCSIAGVPFEGAPIKMWFEEPAGSVTGRLLPTGRPSDVASVPGLGDVEYSFVDVVNPVAFVRAETLGATGTELPAEIESDATLKKQLETIRSAAAVAGGMAEDADAAARSPGVPKVAFVGPPRGYTTLYGERVDAEAVDVVARYMSMGTPHQAFALSGALCAAAGANLPGTVVHDAAEGAMGSQVRLGHASGVMSLDVEATDGEDGLQIQRVAGLRTARRLVEGRVFLRP